MSGASFRLALLRDNKVSQTEISRNTGINISRISQEIHGQPIPTNKHRTAIYKYYSNAVSKPVTYDDFWCDYVVFPDAVPKFK